MNTERCKFCGRNLKQNWEHWGHYTEYYGHKCARCIDGENKQNVNHAKNIRKVLSYRKQKNLYYRVMAYQIKYNIKRQDNLEKIIRRLWKWIKEYREITQRKCIDCKYWHIDGTCENKNNVFGDSPMQDSQCTRWIKK